MNQDKCGSLAKGPHTSGKEINWPNTKNCQLPCQLCILPGFTNRGNQRTGISQSVSSDSDSIGSLSPPFSHVLCHLVLQKHRNPDTVILVGNTAAQKSKCCFNLGSSTQGALCMRVLLVSSRWILHSVVQRDRCRS